MAKGQTPIVEVSIYGVRNQSTISRLEKIAKRPCYMFEAEIPRKTSKNVSTGFPCLLGTFCVARGEAVNLIRSLKSLVKTMKNKPLSCQVFGDIIDFREPLKTIKKRLSQPCESVSSLPTFEESLQTLDRVGTLVVNDSGKVSAESYPEVGPHNEVVCT